MKINTILFDLDGVLLESTKIWIRLYKKTAKLLELRKPTGEEISRLWGNKWDDIIKTLWPKVDTELFKSTFLRLKKVQNIKLSPVKNLVSTLNKLKNSGYNLGIVTGNPKSITMKHLKEADIDLEFFKVIVVEEDTKNHKPNPDPILYACDLLKVKPENVIYVGDSIFDYKSAKNANVEFVAVLTGDVKRKEFRENGVKNIITSVAEIPEFLKVR